MLRAIASAIGLCAAFGLVLYLVYSGDTVQTPESSPASTQPPIAAPTDTNTSVCGEWASAKSSVGSAITQQHGEIRNCGLFGNSRVITTLGTQMLFDGVIATSGIQGVIGVYRCAPEDISCLDGRNDHPLSGWTLYSPPYSGGVTVLSRLDENRLIVDVGGHQLCFNISTAAFGQC